MCRLTPAILIALLTVWQQTGPAETAGEKDGKKRPAAARLFSPIGTLLVREGPGKAWSLPQLYDGLQNGHQLLTLPGAKAVIEAKEGDVRLSLVGNLPELSPSPVLETAVVVNASKDDDLDVTLDRGRILVEGRKEKGPVRVRLRFGKTEMEVELEKKASIALERFTTWRPGVPFVKKPAAGHEPEPEGVFLLLEGKASIAFQGEKRALEGPVRYYWDPRRGAQGPFPLKELPAWLTPAKDKSARATALHKAVEKVRRRLAEKKEIKDFQGLLADKDALVRAVAVLSAGATDDVAPVIAALGNGEHGEARRAAVVQLRHWTARAPDHDAKLYKLLLAEKYTANEAEIVMQLLHSFGERDLRRPETYEALIDYLAGPKLAIRELGHWHLVRLVPRGKEIAFNAAADSAQLAQAQASWRKLIPPGELPKRDKE